MKRNPRYALLFAIFAVGSLLALGYAPTASTQIDKNSKSKARKAQNQASAQSKTPSAPVEDPEVAEDPDLPPGMAGTIDKEAYLRARGDYIDMLRGRRDEQGDEARARAIQQMDKQEAQLKERVRAGLASPANLTDWTFLGPAPIPLGQTSTTRVPVSGRTIAIAVHPTDPDRRSSSRRQSVQTVRDVEQNILT